MNSSGVPWLAYVYSQLEGGTFFRQKQKSRLLLSCAQMAACPGLALDLSKGIRGIAFEKVHQVRYHCGFLWPIS